MALQLSKLSHEMASLGLALATESAKLEELLPDAKEALRAITSTDDLKSKIKRATGLNWSGAIPIHEPVTDTFALPRHPSRANIIAADGSQIYPDRHGVALYYMINIGSIVFPHGSNQVPTCNSQPYLYFETSDMYEENYIVSSAAVNYRRDITELRELASLSASAVDSAPALALLDNRLLLYGTPQSANHRRHDAALRYYLSELDSLRASGAALAGVIDRPQSTEVLRLAQLSRLHIKEITHESLRSLGGFERLRDTMLFNDLMPGERSALFVSGSPDNLDKYQPRRQKICFFYVNAGNKGLPAILRVEVPEWVAQDIDRLNLVHAGVVEQCRVAGGFPYVLMRAHELAVVSTREQRDFDQMVAQEMLRSGLSPSISGKARGKLWTGSHKTRG